MTDATPNRTITSRENMRNEPRSHTRCINPWARAGLLRLVLRQSIAIPSGSPVSLRTPPSTRLVLGHVSSGGGVMSGYRRPRVSGGESPVRLELCGVPGGLPCGDLPGKDVDVGQASCKALSGQRRELDLDHVEPTRVYRCVMELQATRNAPCLLRGITLVRASRACGRSGCPARR